MRVAVLAGGRSSEHDVSLASGTSVREGLADAGHEVLDVRLERDGTWWHEGEELALRPGRGLLGADVVFPALHGPFGEDAWYDYEAKYTPGGMELAVPARIPAAARERVKELAIESFRLAGCSGLARADFFVVGTDVILNELNTMPGFTSTSVYAKLWDASGLPYADLCEELVRIAIARHEHERALRH